MNLSQRMPISHGQNKSIWSRIDHVFLNDLRYDSFDFTHSTYLPNGLSDHTPIILHFPSSPKPPSRFLYCDMWSKHSEFANIIQAQGFIAHRPPMLSLCKYLLHIKKPLQKLNKDHFFDLKEQQARARRNLELLQQDCHLHPGDHSRAAKEKEARIRCISIISSSMDLIKQQSKLEWIKYGDDSTRLFYAKAKKRKMSTYIYTFIDQEGRHVEGFIITRIY